MFKCFTSQEFTATEENYYAGSVNWNLLFSADTSRETLDREQDRIYKLQYRPMFLDKSGKEKFQGDIIHNRLYIHIFLFQTLLQKPQT